MLAKRTSKNQITIPKTIIAQFTHVEYFDVSAENGRIVLAPVTHSKADAVREKLSALGIRESDVEYAIKSARRPRS